MGTKKLPPGHEYWDNARDIKPLCLCCGYSEEAHEAMVRPQEPAFEYEKSLAARDRVFYVRWGINRDSQAEQWEVLDAKGVVLNPSSPITEWDPRAFIERAQMFG